MLGIRLMMAHAYCKMYERGYDALLAFGINFRSLPEYKDSTLLDEADKLVITEGRNKYLLWIERVCNGIDAAVRRKQFRIVNKPGAPVDIPHPTEPER